MYFITVFRSVQKNIFETIKLYSVINFTSSLVGITVVWSSTFGIEIPLFFNGDIWDVIRYT